MCTLSGRTVAVLSPGAQKRGSYPPSPPHQLDSTKGCLMEWLGQRCVMKWMRERDLLIAQTMAFVQSVTGKKPDGRRICLRPTRLRTGRRRCALADATPALPTLPRRCTTSRPCWPRAAPLPNRRKPAPIAPARPAGRLPVRDPGPRRQFPRASGTVQPRARGLLQRHHGQGPRLAQGEANCRRGWANSQPPFGPLLPADLLQHRQQVRQKRLRVFAHREVAEALHDGGLAAGDAVRHRKRLLRRAGIIVFA